MRPVLAVIGLTFALAAAVSAQERGGVRSADVTEIAPFRLTGVEGYVLGGYWSDSDRYASAPGGSSSTTLSNITGKVFLMTHSYVYHPSLLLLDLGAGPVFFRNGFSSDTFDGSSNRTEIDVSARATFLRDKPYRGSVYYDRLNDSQAVGPAQSLLTQNTRYGFDFALLQPVARGFPMRLDGYRFTSKGFGTDQVIDEDTDEINFRVERAWSGLGSTMFHYQGMQTDSRSGSLGLPIQATTSRTQRADLDTTLAFGERKLDTVTNTISYYAIDFANNQATLADDSLFRFDLQYRGQPTDALQTRLRYQFDSIDQNSQGGGVPQSGRLNAANAGATWQATPDLGLNADAYATISRSTAFDSDLTGASASINYRYALPVGELVTSYSTVRFSRDQVAKEPVAQVIGERLTLAGLAWYPLRRPQVIAGTVAVHNTARTQTFLEGVDYILREIGLTTEIQRLAAGAILDGQEVLVDYDHDTGGTFAMTEWDNTIDVAWRLKQAFSVYGRYTDTSPRLTSGVPTAPLNPANELMLGTRADVPFEVFGEQMMAGGVIEWTDRSEVISPATRTLYEAYVESSVPFITRSGLRLGARQQTTEYELTPLQDVTQRTYTLRFWSRYRTGITLYVEAMTNRDSGSPQVEREYRQASAKALWRVRQLLMSLRLDATKQIQAGSDHTRTRIQFDVRRDF